MNMDGWELPPGVWTHPNPMVRKGAAAGLPVFVKQVTEAEPLVVVVQG